MLRKSIMSTIVKEVAEFGLQTTTSGVEEPLPYEACIVDFGFDEKKRPVALQILHYSQDLLSSIQEGEKSSNPLNLTVLSFVMTIPVEIPHKTTAEVLRFISLANKSLPLGALNCSEVEKSVYYSYSLPLFGEAPNEVTLLTILHTALFVKETFLSSIEEVAEGKSTVHSLQEAALEPKEKHPVKRKGK